MPCSCNSDLITMICYDSTAVVSCANVLIVIIYMGTKSNSRWIWYTYGIFCAMGPWNKMASLVNFVFFQLSENIPWVNWIREAVLFYTTMGIPRMLLEASVSNLMLWGVRCFINPIPVYSAPILKTLGKYQCPAWCKLLQRLQWLQFDIQSLIWPLLRNLLLMAHFPLLVKRTDVR